MDNLEDIKLGTCSKCEAEGILYEWMDGDICSDCMMVEAMSMLLMVANKKDPDNER